MCLDQLEGNDSNPVPENGTVQVVELENPLYSTTGTLQQVVLNNSTGILESVYSLVEYIPDSLSIAELQNHRGDVTITSCGTPRQ